MHVWQRLRATLRHGLNAIKSLLHFTLWVQVGHHSGGNLWSICEELGDIGWLIGPPLIWTSPKGHDLIFLAVCALACEWPSSYLLMFCDWRTLLMNCDWINSYQWPPWHEVCTEICFTLYAVRTQRYTINSGGCVYRSIKAASFFSFVHINGLGLLCSEQNGGKFSFVRRTRQAKLSLKYHLQKHENS